MDDVNTPHHCPLTAKLLACLHVERAVTSRLVSVLFGLIDPDAVPPRARLDVEGLTAVAQALGRKVYAVATAQDGSKLFSVPLELRQWVFENFEATTQSGDKVVVGFEGDTIAFSIEEKGPPAADPALSVEEIIRKLMRGEVVAVDAAKLPDLEKSLRQEAKRLGEEADNAGTRH